MITLEHDRLEFQVPEVHEDARFNISFQRTLRIPDDDTDYPLPPGLGRFPLRHVDDYADRLSERDLRRGGIILPMHQAEAMWINFETQGPRRFGYPFAVKIAAGKINAVTGKPWSEHLNDDPQDYMVVPEQPWLDGYSVGQGIIRQFVAMPLGAGYSAEEQITGAAEFGGLQIMAWPMKADFYERILAARLKREQEELRGPQPCYSMMPDAEMSMGLAPGGRMRQAIYDDPYGLDAWDQRHGSRCFVTIANTANWIAVTGEVPPTSPPTAADYSRRGLPWFEYYNADAEVLAGSKVLGDLKSVKRMGEASGESPLPENESVEGILPFRLGRQIRKVLREGKF